MSRVMGFDAYIDLQRRRISKLKAGKRRGPITSARFMAAQLRMMSARSALVRGNVFRRGATAGVRGNNPSTNFPYIHWINATPGSGLESIRLVPPFGDGRKYAYAQVARRVVPGFYFIAQARTRQFNVAGMLQATRDALSAAF